MYEALADTDLPWAATTLFQVDERIAPAGDPDRNLTHLVLALPPALQERIRPMPVGEDDLEAAARRYAKELSDPLDLVHLGIGPDGHTASLVPGDGVLEVSDRRVALTTGEYQGRRRMTLTYPALDAAREIVWLVEGDDKQEATTRLRRCDKGIPAGRVSAANATLIADTAAL
jgi:6-phosphogluconolactonase/glucosamine-6-phosphate isomerase/deaminase